MTTIVLVKRPVRRLPLGILGENIILCRHRRMAREAAVGVGPLRRKSVRSGIIVKIAVCPSMRVGKSFGIFFDYVNRFKSVRHLHEIWGHSVLFEGPLDL